MWRRFHFAKKKIKTKEKKHHTSKISLARRRRLRRRAAISTTATRAAVPGGVQLLPLPRTLASGSSAPRPTQSLPARHLGLSTRERVRRSPSITPRASGAGRRRASGHPLPKCWC